MARLSRDTINIAAFSLLWLLAIVAVNPLGAFPMTDDWAYAETVRTLVESGRLHFSDWNAATLFTQIFWGALFGSVFGPSNGVLRISTLVATWLGAIAFYRLLRLTRAGPAVALTGTLVLLFNPLSFLFAFSFMTDLPYTSLQIAAMWLLALGGLSLSYLPRALGWAAGVAALLIRQVGFAIAIGNAGEALLRSRGKLRRIVLAVLPVVAFVAVQELFHAWLEARGNAPALYGKHISSMLEAVAHPVAAARNVATVGFQCVLYIGFLTLPLNVVAASVWWDRVGRRMRLAVIGAAIAATAALLAVGIRFPSWINSLQRYGIGQDIAGRLTPDWAAIPLTAFAVFGTVLLLANVAAAAWAWYRRERDDRFDTTIFALVMALLLFAPLPFVFLRLDRYLIPILPCVVVVVAELFRSAAPSRGGIVAGFAATALLVLGSVGATHDYMAAKRAQWAAFADLSRHVPADHIDAGWVLNGPVSFGRYGSRTTITGWFAADDYRIDSEPAAGFRTIARYKVDAWLPINWNDRFVLVQQKVARAAR